MKIGLYDVDSHNFPNLALMKISAWHKKQGAIIGFFILLPSGKIMCREKMEKLLKNFIIFRRNI